MRRKTDRVRKKRGHKYVRALLMKLRHSKEVLRKRRSPESYLVHWEE